MTDCLFSSVWKLISVSYEADEKKKVLRATQDTWITECKAPNTQKPKPPEADLTTADLRRRCSEPGLTAGTKNFRVAIS